MVADLRRNIDAMTRRLENRGVREILETSVICYSTPSSGDLTEFEHRGGRERGTEIFQTLLQWVEPSILIAHGVGTRKELGKVLGETLPKCPAGPEQWAIKPVTYEDNRFLVFVIPTLALPWYNQWHTWAPGYLDAVALKVAQQLAER